MVIAATGAFLRLEELQRRVPDPQLRCSNGRDVFYALRGSSFSDPLSRLAPDRCAVADGVEKVKSSYHAEGIGSVRPHALRVRNAPRQLLEPQGCAGSAESHVSGALLRPPGQASGTEHRRRVSELYDQSEATRLETALGALTSQDGRNVLVKINIRLHRSDMYMCIHIHTRRQGQRWHLRHIP